jgi:hypothetical protein
MSCRYIFNNERSLEYVGTDGEKVQALSLAKDRYSMKLELLTNATVVDDVIKFIETEKEKNNDIQRSEEKDTDSASKIIV